jgi:hypothetical protein
MIDPMILYKLNITTSFIILQQDTITVIHSNMKIVNMKFLLIVIDNIRLPFIKNKKLRYTIPYPTVMVDSR